MRNWKTYSGTMGKDDSAELLELPAYPFQVFRYAALVVNKTGFATVDVFYRYNEYTGV